MTSPVNVVCPPVMLRSSPQRRSQRRARGSVCPLSGRGRACPPVRTGPRGAPAWPCGILISPRNLQSRSHGHLWATAPAPNPAGSVTAAELARTPWRLKGGGGPGNSRGHVTLDRSPSSEPHCEGPAVPQPRIRRAQGCRVLTGCLGTVPAPSCGDGIRAADQSGVQGSREQIGFRLLPLGLSFHANASPLSAQRLHMECP